MADIAKLAKELNLLYFYPTLKLSNTLEITHANAIKLIGSKFSTILRQDENNFWILKTAENDPNGSYDGNRFFQINYDKGYVKVDKLQFYRGGGGSWIDGKTKENGLICIQSKQNGSSGPYYPYLSTETWSGDTLTLGGVADSFGFYGFKKDKTTNSVDCSAYLNTEKNTFYVNGWPCGNSCGTSASPSGGFHGALYIQY